VKTEKSRAPRIIPNATAPSEKTSRLDDPDLRAGADG